MSPFKSKPGLRVATPGADWVVRASWEDFSGNRIKHQQLQWTQNVATLNTNLLVKIVLVFIIMLQGENVLMLSHKTSHYHSMAMVITYTEIGKNVKSFFKTIFIIYRGCFFFFFVCVVFSSFNVILIYPVKLSFSSISITAPKYFRIVRIVTLKQISKQLYPTSIVILCPLFLNFFT